MTSAPYELRYINTRLTISVSVMVRFWIYGYSIPYISVSALLSLFSAEYR